MSVCLSAPLLKETKYHFLIIFLILPPTDVPDRFSYSPLHWATRVDNQPILLALIEGGANVNAKGHVGKTPLHIAVRIKTISF